MWLAVARSGQDPEALDKAIGALQHAASMEPTGEALALLGEARVDAGELPLAERTLQQATQKPPVDRGTFLRLADAAERLGHTRDARSALVDYYSLLDPQRPQGARDGAPHLRPLAASLANRGQPPSGRRAETVAQSPEHSSELMSTSPARSAAGAAFSTSP